MVVLDELERNRRVLVLPKNVLCRGENKAEANESTHRPQSFGRKVPDVEILIDDDLECRTKEESITSDSSSKCMMPYSRKR